MVSTIKEIKYQDKPWLGSYADGVPEKNDFDFLCLPEFLERSARLFPKNTALNFMGYTLTYQELNDMADRFASVLKNFGIKKGDSVACILPNTITCVAAYYGIMKAGAIAVMNNPLYSDKELLHQLKAEPPVVQWWINPVMPVTFPVKENSSKS